MKKQKGFTLIELLVVIAIIGILATIVMVSLNTARQKARDTKRISDLRQVQLALQMYQDANGSYPASGGVALEAAISPTYITTMPEDPTTTNPYAYASCGTGYTLGATLEADNAVLDGDVDTATCALTGYTPDNCADTGNNYCVEP